MRYSLVFTIAIFLLMACKKDNFTTAPQISFKSISPNVVDNTSATPILTIHVTDAEGDLGLNGKDTAFIYMKNLKTNTFDSLLFPDLQAVAKSNFKADVDIDISKVLRCKSLPGFPLHTDTLYFQVYIKDFAKNKSNVIVTDDPVYYICR
ncbi:MAG: hypothetical protein ABI666_09485 [Ferruginibacter sp.]